MRMCEFVDEWYVLKTTQNGEFVCYQSSGKPLVETGLSVSRDRRTSCAVLRVVAQLAQCALLERGLLCSSVVSSISVTVQWTCCVTHMTRTPQRLKKIAFVITAQFISLRMVAELGLLF